MSALNAGGNNSYRTSTTIEHATIIAIRLKLKYQLFHKSHQEPPNLMVSMCPRPVVTVDS